MLQDHIAVRLLFLAITVAMLWMSFRQIKSGWAPTSRPMPAGWINRQTSPLYYWWTVIGTFVGAVVFLVAALFADTGNPHD